MLLLLRLLFEPVLMPFPLGFLVLIICFFARRRLCFIGAYLLLRAGLCSRDEHYFNGGRVVVEWLPLLGQRGL